ncbi:MAG: hypothetical protein HOI95_20790, partial [Chromatiales bacterium]|nr:hypothetical protein [Chromatiales bacterium]
MRLIRTIILALLGVTFYGASGADEPDFLPVDQAFVLDARIVGDAIHFDWRIAEGYYLVRSRLAVVSDAGAVTLGKMVTPPGKIKQDPYFGAVQVYRGAVLIEVPVLSGEGELTVRATAQGCADAGLCYPPSTRTVSLTVPASVGSSEIHTALLATHSSAGSTEAGTALTQALGLNPSADAQTQDALPNSSLLADSGSGGALGALGQLSKVFGFGGDPKFLPADEAFELDHRLVGRYLELSWQIADGYYLYRDKVRVTVRPESGISPGPPQMAMGTAKSDEYFGTMQVFYDQAVARVALQGQPAAAQLDVNIRYQGCADAGLCYPPIDKQVSVAMPFNWGTPASDAGLGGSSTAIAGGESDNQRSTLAGLPASEQDVLENLLGTGGLWVVIGSFFAAGLLLSLTPCVFPMVPILSGIIVGEGQSCSRRRAFMLSFVYVQGMALTYTIAGVVAGMYHINAQAALQDPWVLSASVIVFV